MEYRLNFEDRSLMARDFIDDAKFHAMIGVDSPGADRPVPIDAGRFGEVIERSLAREPLSVEETAVLLAAVDPESVERIFDAARQLKREVYGNRIVIFAPLYLGNLCRNDCAYCAFRRSNPEQIRRTLIPEELDAEVRQMLRTGQKRSIFVWGEHANYTPQVIADTVRAAYAIHEGHGNLRRININAAPLDHEGYRIVKEAGIGTYQVFQETYHRPTFERVHPIGTPKHDFLWRLDSHSRAMEAGIDDVGLGALIGLYDWRYEVLGLVEHSNFLRKEYGVGPHTLSFPRLQPAAGTMHDARWLTDDAQFMRLVAILRLAVPYTGLIMTARESPEVRRTAMGFGVSQIDAGTRLEIGGYSESDPSGESQQLDREQFQLGDTRPLDTVVRELCDEGFIPSFCTACYRLGRTGEVFMEYAIPGFIQQMCTPNAATTLMEYCVDYASPETAVACRRAIEREFAAMPEDPRKTILRERLQLIESTDQRDLYF